MVLIQVCVGSSCHLKGSREIVELLQKQVEKEHLGEEVILCGGFCAGKCNRIGVTITVDDDVFTGVTPEMLPAFWQERILPHLDKQEVD